MKLTTLVETTRIRQEVRELDVALETTHITSPEDAFCVAKRFIQDDDRCHPTQYEKPRHCRPPATCRKYQFQRHPFKRNLQIRHP